MPCLVFVMALAFLAGSVAAQPGYPERPIRLVVPLPPGASNDVVARAFARKLSEVLGQQVVVDNRGGAGGLVGNTIVAKALADGPVLPHIKAGRLRLLAIGASARDPALPGVPTISEEGVHGFEVVGWYGILARGGTPAPVIKKLHAEVVRILALPAVGTVYQNGRLEATSSASPAEFDALIRAERAKWAKVIKAAGIRIERAQPG